MQSRPLNRPLSRLLVLLLASAGAMTGVVTAPASAAVCGSGAGAGVSVVVDFTGNPDGGGATSACDPGGAGDAAREVFGRHYALQDDPREQGYVCRIDGHPASGDCRQTDGYWGLFHSDGRDGRWTYASVGVDGLSVPDGGSVAFAWQNGGGTDHPRIAPPVTRDDAQSSGGESSGTSPSRSSSPSPSGASSSSRPSSTPSTPASTSPSTSTSGAPAAGNGDARRLRRQADREADRQARATARADEGRAARVAERREAEAADRRREARRERRQGDGEETAADRPAPDVDPPAAAADAAAGQVPTWLTVLVLGAMAALAVLLAVLRRRAARTG